MIYLCVLLMGDGVEHQSQHIQQENMGKSSGS
jgi:hypothetical protein